MNFISTSQVNPVVLNDLNSSLTESVDNPNGELKFFWRDILDESIDSEKLKTMNQAKLDEKLQM
jgi:hypothetical protein